MTRWPVSAEIVTIGAQSRNFIALRKLRMNEPLTPTDIQELERLLFESSDLGDKEAFERVYGKQGRLGTFLRRLVGLDREAAKKAFADYLNASSFNANQIRFVNQKRTALKPTVRAVVTEPHAERAGRWPRLE